MKNFITAVAVAAIISFTGIAIASHGSSQGVHTKSNGEKHYQGDGHISGSTNTSEHAEHGTDAGEANHKAEHPAP